MKYMEQNLEIAKFDLTKSSLITNTIQKRKHKIYLDIVNKCQHVSER